MAQNIVKGSAAIRQQVGTAIQHPVLIAQANVQEARSAYADNRARNDLDLATGGR